VHCHHNTNSIGDKMKTVLFLLAANVLLVTQVVYSRPPISAVIADLEVVPPPTVQELEIIIRSANAGDGVAHLRLGDVYFFGSGATQNFRLALEHYQQAAAQGIAQAQFNLGNIYDFGKGVPANDLVAYRWYQLAAEQGHIQSQYSVGVFLDQGRGIVKDEVAAVGWFQRAASHGYVRAQFNLGNMLADGRGIVQNSLEAMKWLRLSAQGGYPEAQLNLAHHYATGNLGTLNKKRAYLWYSVVTINGGLFEQQARQGQIYLEERISARSARELKLAAQRCIKIDYKGCD
jgi:uncharacterized protein